MRTAAFVVLGFSGLVLQAALGVLLPLNEWVPNLLLPMVIYLGVAHDVHIVRGALVSFTLGYLLDSFCGNPMGLETFIMLAMFLVARGAGLNLFMRGPLLQAILTSLFAVVAGGATLALRAIFEPPAPFPIGSISHSVFSLCAGAAVTGAAAPVMFLAIRRIDGLAARRREEAAAA